MKWQWHSNLSKRCFYKILFLQADKVKVSSVYREQTHLEWRMMFLPFFVVYLLLQPPIEPLQVNMPPRAVLGAAVAVKISRSSTRLVDVSNLSRGHAHKHNSVVSRREWITVGPKTVLNHRCTEDYSLQVVIF